MTRELRFTAMPWLLIMVVLCLSSCTSDKQTEALLERAQSVMEASPDSAFHILDSIAPFMAEKAENLRMRHLMLSSQAQNKLYIPFTTDSIMKVVVEYYDHHGSPNERMLAHHLLGCTYRDMKDYPAALSCLYDAIECADTLDTDCNHIYLSNIYIQMYELFYNQYMQTKALEALQQARHHAEKAGDRYRAGQCVNIMSRIYFMLDDTVNMLETSREARTLLLAESRHQEAARTYNSDILVAVERSEYDSARTLMNVYETESGLFDDKGDIQTGYEKYYYIKGMYFLGLNRTDSAEICFRKLGHSDYILDAQKGLLELYKKKKDTDSIIKYSTIYEESLNIWVNSVKNENVGKIIASNNYNRHKNLAVAKEREANESHLLNMLLLFALVMTIIIGAIVVWAYRWKKSTELNLMEKDYQKLTREKEYLLKELESAKEVHLHNEKMISILANLREVMVDNSEKSTIIQHNILSKLTEEIEISHNSQVNIVRSKEAEIEALGKQIQDYKEKLGRMEDNLINESHEIIVLFKETVKDYRKDIITERDWEKLYDAVQRLNPNFAAQISSVKDLSDYEKKTVFLLMIGLTNKEIGILLGATPQKVTNWKTYANKKLFSDESAATLQKNLSEL